MCAVRYQEKKKLRGKKKKVVKKKDIPPGDRGFENKRTIRQAAG